MPTNFGVITAVFPYIPKCVSVHMHQGENKTTVRFTGHSRIARLASHNLVGLELGGGSYNFQTICEPLHAPHITSASHKTIQSIYC
jgi:hypothetical protein